MWNFIKLLLGKLYFIEWTLQSLKDLREKRMNYSKGWIIVKFEKNDYFVLKKRLFLLKKSYLKFYEKNLKDHPKKGVFAFWSYQYIKKQKHKIMRTA